MEGMQYPDKENWNALGTVHFVPGCGGGEGWLVVLMEGGGVIPKIWLSRGGREAIFYVGGGGSPPPKNGRFKKA